MISAAGLAQFAAIMGNCVAGGAYLPVLCDKILMTQGSGLYLAGPSLVKAAIGQIVDAEELGGAKMHSEISGTVDFFEKDDPSCLKRLRSLVALLPEAKSRGAPGGLALPKPAKNPDSVYNLISFDGRQSYDARDLLAMVVDENSLDEYKADYGKTLVTAYARVNGRPVGIVANQRVQVRTNDTDLTRRARQQVADLHDFVLARTPAGRWGAPDDLGGAAVFLCSPASDFVTGAALPVDGGYSARG